MGSAGARPTRGSKPAVPVELDALGSCRPHPEAVRAALPWLSDLQANPHAPHARGRAARAAMEWARAQVASWLGVPDSWVIFTSGVTEANNLAIFGWARAAPPDAQVAVAPHDHASLLHPARELDRRGRTWVRIPVDRQGRVHPDVEALRPGSLVALSHGHPELGALQAVARICSEAHDRGAFVLVDCALTAGRLPLSWEALGRPAFVSLSFHHFGGLMGAGALVAAPEVTWRPLFHGGTQELGYRPGSPNLAGIAAGGAAARVAAAESDTRRRRLEAWAATLSNLLANAPGVRLTGPPAPHRIPGHVSGVVPGLDGEALVQGLSERAVLAATGSPCADEAGLPSSSLLAAGWPEDEARASVVLSFHPTGHYRDQDLRWAAEAFSEEVRRLRRLAGTPPPGAPAT